MKITLVVLALFSMIVPAQAEQAFKNYGFSSTFPLTLTQEPTEMVKDSSGNPTKTDYFSVIAEGKYYVVQVETYGTVVDKDITTGDLVDVLQSMTDERTTMGKPRVFQPYYDCHHGADECLIPAIPAVRVLFTKTNKDGGHTYLDTVLVLRSNRMYLLRAAYATQQPEDKDDLEDLLFFVSFKLL